VDRGERRVERRGAIELDERIGHASPFQVGGGERGAHPRGGGRRRAGDGALEPGLHARDGGIPLREPLGHRVERSLHSGAFSPRGTADCLRQVDQPADEVVLRLGLRANRGAHEPGQGGHGGNEARHYRHPKRTERVYAPRAAQGGPRFD
jgi:hypothetical protein